MNTKHIGFLALATLLIVLGALAVKLNHSASVSDTVIGANFFPDLGKRANEVTSIEIVKGNAKITLTRSGERWVIRERADYPANIDQIRALVLALVDLKSVESKTSKPEQYLKLGVEDPSGEEATGVGVTLKDADGSPIAAIVIGNIYEGGDPAKKLLYVRRLADAQSWLVEGAVEVPVRSSDWILKEQVVDILRPRIKSMKIALPSGDQYFISRDKPDDKGFRYAPLPKNMKIRSQARLDDMASALEHVVPSDVVAAGTISFDPAKSARGEYRTFDGIVVKTQLVKRDEDWAVSYAASLAEGVTASEEVTKEVQKLQALSPWVFVIPETKATLMMKSNDDVLVAAGK